MKNYRKKQTLYLIILITFMLIIGGSITLTIIYMDDYLFSTLFLLITIVFLLFLFYFKSKYDFYTRHYQREKMLETAVKPLKIKYSISYSNIVKELEKNGYVIYTSNAQFILLYKINDKKVRRFKRILYAGLIFLDPSVSFDDVITNNYFASLEENLYKKEKYMQRIFFQLKINNEISHTEANNILFVTSRRENYVFINILFNDENNTIYFLHSKTFTPNRYYTLATTEISSLFVK